MDTPQPNLCFHHETINTFGRQKPTPELPLMHRVGPFTGVLAPTETSRIVGSYPDALYIGLMAKLPRPDGVGGREVDVEGYERQIATLQPRDGQHFCVPRPVMFEVHRCPNVDGVGLFDQQTGGKLVAYGAIVSSRLSKTPVSRVEISGYQLLIKRCSSDFR